jgi:hypothetical protein
MRTVVERVDLGPARAQKLVHAVVDPLDIVPSLEATVDPGLVGYANDQVVVLVGE